MRYLVLYNEHLPPQSETVLNELVSNSQLFADQAYVLKNDGTRILTSGKFHKDLGKLNQYINTFDIQALGAIAVKNHTILREIPTHRKKELAKKCTLPELWMLIANLPNEDDGSWDWESMASKRNHDEWNPGDSLHGHLLKNKHIPDNVKNSFIDTFIENNTNEFGMLSQLAKKSDLSSSQYDALFSRNISAVNTLLATRSDISVEKIDILLAQINLDTLHVSILDEEQAKLLLSIADNPNTKPKDLQKIGDIFFDYVVKNHLKGGKKVIDPYENSESNLKNFHEYENVFMNTTKGKILQAVCRNTSTPVPFLLDTAKHAHGTWIRMALCENESTPFEALTYLWNYDLGISGVDAANALNHKNMTPKFLLGIAKSFFQGTGADKEKDFLKHPYMFTRVADDQRNFLPGELLNSPHADGNFLHYMAGKMYLYGKHYAHRDQSKLLVTHKNLRTDTMKLIVDKFFAHSLKDPALELITYLVSRDDFPKDDADINAKLEKLFHDEEISQGHERQRVNKLSGKEKENGEYFINKRADFLAVARKHMQGNTSTQLSSEQNTAETDTVPADELTK